MLIGNRTLSRLYGVEMGCHFFGSDRMFFDALMTLPAGYKLKLLAQLAYWIMNVFKRRRLPVTDE